jgi:hypothetical protein
VSVPGSTRRIEAVAKLVSKKIRAKCQWSGKNFDPRGSRATAFKAVSRFRTSASAFDHEICPLVAGGFQFA